MKIISVVGARPNFMKIAPFIKEIEKYNKLPENLMKIEHLLLHTGQHYDDRMNNLFFESLDIPKPDINLGVGSGSHAQQVGNTMILFEQVLIDHRPDWIVVVGDVNATLACSITAKKENIKCCHIEAGLRSGDLTMPEEINRIVTDRLSDLLLTPDPLSSENLLKEGVSEDRIKFVGNIMIDTLKTNLETAKKIRINDILSNNILIPRHKSSLAKQNVSSFGLITMHRPSNVDLKHILEPLLNFFINEVSIELPLIWPIHPRTQKQLKRFNLWDDVINTPNIFLLHPINYHDMLRLNLDAKVMFTDSGGLQEECSVLGTPCITLRWNTERPITLREKGGVSVLVGNDVKNIRKEFKTILVNNKLPFYPELWDGHTAERCLSEIINYQERTSQ